MNKIEKWRDEFSFLEGNDRLMYIIDLAKNQTSLPKELRTEDRLVKGCMSQIWIDVGLVEDLVQVYYDSDAMITKGITSIVCECYSNLPLKESLMITKGITSVICDCFSDISLSEALAITRDDLNKLGIKELLTAQRRNGLSSLIDNIQTRLQRL